MPSIEERMKEQIGELQGQLQDYIDRLDAPKTLKDSMLYSLQSGGKRIRPLLLFATLEAFRKDWRAGLPVACAVEMIHTYSLIHDDLPCMDDDDLRRGKPTNHKVFGEAVAVLAGDALLTYSFQILSEAPPALLDDRKKILIISELARAAGPEGMVAGQTLDMEAEDRRISLEELESIHLHKTGKLISFCVKAGAILADADEKTQAKLSEFARRIGLAFQIRDDILDIVGKAEILGKNVGSDQSKKKSTYPALLSLEGADKKLEETIFAAKTILRELPLETSSLERITEQIWKREN
ncbi:Dimethylallyltransferase [Caldibacillus debilis]|uniref:Farnesyl diphosphate synthase n=2 Tax=Caldibacillus debilis TaxID=301148 RepID=A0A150M7C4_9BACI|nr:Dimethylallyltransferase [Caldibacillus debilis]